MPRIVNEIVDIGIYESGFGDYDGDLVLSLDDFTSWGDCFTGPDGESYPTGCEVFDGDCDGDVDLADFASFQSLFTLPQTEGDD